MLLKLNRAQRDTFSSEFLGVPLQPLSLGRELLDSGLLYLHGTLGLGESASDPLPVLPPTFCRFLGLPEHLLGCLLALVCLF